MSSVSSPIHRYSADIESLLYDQNFTAEISNRMRVPSKILVTGEGGGGGGSVGNHFRGAEDTQSDILDKKDSKSPPAISRTMLEKEIQDKVNIMQVPDRIILAGHDEHVGVKAPPRELHLEKILRPPSSTVRVETPPRVLTLEDHFFPTVDADSDEDEAHMSNNVNHVSSDVPNAKSSENPSGDVSMEVYYGDTTGGLSESSPTELAYLRRHMVKLNRRIMRLEQDSQKRQQREMLLYSMGVAYFVLKTFLWLHRHW